MRLANSWTSLSDECSSITGGSSNNAATAAPGRKRAKPVAEPALDQRSSFVLYTRDAAGALVDAYLNRPPGQAANDHENIITDCLKLLESQWDAEPPATKQGYDAKLMVSVHD